jgi:hypothetical protein
MNNKLYEQSKKALDILYDSIIKLLEDNPNGLTNNDITIALGLRSSQNGKQKDYLAYSLLGNLMSEGKVIKIIKDNKSYYKYNK